MPKGKKGFQSGDYWNGNSGGAKKKEFRRDAFTDEIFAERKADVREVVQIWFTYAKSGQKWAIEIKRSTAPKLEKGFHLACLDIQPNRSFAVYPGERRYPMSEDIEAIGLYEMMNLLSNEESI